MVKSTKVIVQEESATVSEAEHLKQQMKPKPKGFKAEIEALSPTETEEEPVKEEKPDPVLAAIAQLNEKVDQLSADKEASDNRVTELESQLEDQRSEAEGAIAELQTQHQQELEAVNADKQAADERVTRLEGLFKLTGNQHATTEAEATSMDSAPNVNTLLASERSPKGMYREIQSILDSAQIAQKYTGAGALITTRDNRELNAFIRHARKDSKTWHQLLMDVESHAKANGLLRGPSSKVTDRNAATVGADIDGGFLDTLSVIMRTNNRPQYIFRNFANTRIDFAQGLGDTVKVPRAAYQTGPSNPNDRLLSGAGTFANIDSTNQRLQTGTVSALIDEWGLGKNSEHPPVGIPSFVQAYSMIDLMGLLERNLGEDYYRWEDMKVRSLWAPTSRVVYNDGDDVTTTTANADGSVTLQFLNNLYGYMRGLKIQTYLDGCYGIVLISKDCSQFRNEMIADGIWQAPSREALEALSNSLSISVGMDVGPTDLAAAYQGKHGNFHIFDTNAYGTGTVGTAGADGEGVQTETVAAGAATTRSNYAFGADTIGRGIGTEMEIRRDTNDNFGRVGRYIWRSEEGFVAMDVDPTGYSDTSEVPQQLRVLDVRTIG